MKTKEVYVDSFKNVWMDIYVVGYPEEGESILCVIRDKRDIKYTFMTDSYIFCHTKGWYNHVDHLLNQMKVDHLDAFIWTHPDLDHSLDIPRMLDTYDKLHQAQIYMPSLDGVNGMKPVAVATNNYLYNKYSAKGSQKYHVKVVDVDEYEENDEKMVLAKGMLRVKIIEKYNITGAPIACVFKYMSPIRDYVSRYEHFHMKPNFNDLSLSVALSVNGKNILLCGDIEDRTIKRIDDNCLHDVVYIKIPHHASGKSSGYLFERLQKNQIRAAIATTTIYKANNLPEVDLLKKYKTISKEVYTTGSNKQHLYGCIKSSVHIEDFNIETICDGSAMVV